MCELFGGNANKRIDINFTWKGFVRKAYAEEILEDYAMLSDLDEEH